MTDIDPDRLTRGRRALSKDRQDPSASLCATSARLVGVAGAGVVLMSRGQPLGSVCVSDRRTEAVEDMQYALGEGPCRDAFLTRAPVLVPDLERMDAGRWAAFRPGALDAGMRAAFGFPMLVGATCVGALDLYHDAVGDLTGEQFADAEAMAYLAAETVLGWQAVAEDALPWQLEQVPLHRAVVHQAAGMVAVQASVSVEDALLLVRAHAFAGGRTVGDVARDVVAGELRIDG